MAVLLTWQMGSTEWVEDNADVLNARAVAYINVDSATNGNGFLQGGATPQLDMLIMEAAAKVGVGRGLEAWVLLGFLVVSGFFWGFLGFYRGFSGGF